MKEKRLSGRHWALTLILILSLPAAAQISGAPTLVFRIGDQPIRTLDREELRSSLTVHDIRLYDARYETQKHFRAFAIADVMNAGFGDDWHNPAYTEVVFIASDGYRAVSTPEKLSERGGYLAFADLDEPAGWEPIGSRQVDPGPFYLVWSGEQQSTANGYPWPWQLASISLVDFRLQYPEIYPKGTSADSSTMRGFELFKDRCVRCHAMNRQGGKIGPDLNAPMSITEYRSPLMIREFIRHPSRYRYSHMPDHEDLSPQNLDDLLDYFRYKASTPSPVQHD